MTKERHIYELERLLSFGESMCPASKKYWKERKDEVLEAVNNTNLSTATDIVKALREAEYRGYMKAVAERPQGEWIPDPDGGFKCSNCRAEEDEFIYGTGMRHVNGESEFCPNCGAKMKGERNENYI